MYFFRYRARNRHGWSEGYSPIQAILLATVPTATAQATTTNAGLDVVIAWDAPPSDGAAPIVGYRIRLKGSDGLYLVEATCDGMGPD